MRVVFADGVQLERHWNASPFGRVWAEPGLAALRGRLDAWLAEAKRASGVDLASVTRTGRGIQLRFLGIDAQRQPRWVVQADLGMQAAQMARRLAAAEGSAQALVVSGADEAWSLSAQILARFGGIVSFGRPADLLPLAPVVAEGDLAVDIDGPALLGVLRASLQPAQAVQVGPLLDLLARRWQALALRASLDPDGVVWSARCDGDTTGLRPADRTLLARLPANASTVQLIGIEGAAWWQAWGPDLTTACDLMLHAGQARGAAATLGELHAGLAALGFTVDLPALVQGLSGTVAIVQTPGASIPGYSIAVPRSPALDRVVADLCVHLGCRQPEEGGFALLPIPDLPLPIQLARDRGHWLIGSDALLASTWGEGQPGGFDGTAMGRELAAGAPAAACILGANDLAPTLRMLLGPINMRLAMVHSLNQAEKQAVILGTARLAAVLPPGCHWGVASPGRLDLQGHGGDVLWVALPAILTAVAIPSLLERNVMVEEARP